MPVDKLVLSKAIKAYFPASVDLHVRPTATHAEAEFMNVQFR